MEQQAGWRATALAGYHLTKGQARLCKWVALAVAMVAGVVLTGCQEAATGGGGSSSAGGAGGSSPISPPSWIIGTWQTPGLSWTFTANNAVHTGQNTSINFAELAQTGGGTVSDTSPSATQYRITLYVRYSSSSVSQRYDFHKTGPDVIEYSVTTNGVGLGPLTLRKR